MTQRIVPVLIYADIAAAHDFLVDTFGFVGGGVHRAGDGTVVHGEVSHGDDVVWLHQVSPDHGLRGHAEVGSGTGMLNVLVDDVDAHHRRSAAAGATIVYAPTDQPYGQREYAATDCEGRLWSFATTT